MSWPVLVYCIFINIDLDAGCSVTNTLLRRLATRGAPMAIGLLWRGYQHSNIDIGQAIIFREEKHLCVCTCHNMLNTNSLSAQLWQVERTSPKHLCLK